MLDPTSELGRFEEKVRREEALVAGKQELAASSLDSQFESLEDLDKETEVEARLAELKADAGSAGDHLRSSSRSPQRAERAGASSPDACSDPIWPAASRCSGCSRRTSRSTGSEHFYDGRSAILFATVAGVSLGLLTGGRQPAAARANAASRAAAIALRAARPHRDRRAPDDAACSRRSRSSSTTTGSRSCCSSRCCSRARPVLAVAALAGRRDRAAGRRVRCATDVDTDSASRCCSAVRRLAGVRHRTRWRSGWRSRSLGLICARSDLSRRRTQLVMIGGGRGRGGRRATAPRR